MTVKRGDIYYADLSPVIGSEQGGLRPVLIIQNDIGNRYSPTVIAAAITSRMSKARLPTHIDIYAKEVGLAKDSVILLEQIRTLDKRRLKEKMGHLDDTTMDHVNTAIAISFGLGNAEEDAANRAMMQRTVSSYTPRTSPAVASVGGIGATQASSAQSSAQKEQGSADRPEGPSFPLG
ncbi:MAG: type II toxin-antitoxin system PemK/MazF family toxin [Ruminococcaceae bacterium]|nr:type II toxin-antitoxin system PemK/MazF family toxin [Oscillospiraceae bacterium]